MTDPKKRDATKSQAPKTPEKRNFNPVDERDDATLIDISKINIDEEGEEGKGGEASKAKSDVSSDKAKKGILIPLMKEMMLP